MAIPLDPTPAQNTRILEAVASYNAQHGTTLTTKRWIYMVLGRAVLAQLQRSATDPIQVQATAAIAAARQAITNDMQGGA